MNVYNRSMGRIFSPAGVLALLLVSLWAGLPAVAFADLRVSPAVIDGAGKPREILRYTVLLTNNSDRMVTLYPWVRDIDPAVGEVPFDDGASPDTHLSRWVELSRAALDLMPRESREVAVLVQVDLRARPGVYHANLGWSAGADRLSAETPGSDGVRVALNITVRDDANERLELGSFAPSRSFFGGGLAEFAYRLENVGNRGIVPKGSVRIFDRTGEEVATIEANAEGKRLEPDARELLGAAWAADGRFGRYKATLDLSYGERQTIHDTVYFWVIPWARVFSLFSSLALVAVVLAILAHSFLAHRREREFAYEEAMEEVEHEHVTLQEDGDKHRFANVGSAVRVASALLARAAPAIRSRRPRSSVVEPQIGAKPVSEPQDNVGHMARSARSIVEGNLDLRSGNQIGTIRVVERPVAPSNPPPTRIGEKDRGSVEHTVDLAARASIGRDARHIVDLSSRS
jgi:hypothetical protein